MNKIIIDFETFSKVKLKNIGAHKYAQDKSTDLLSLSYGFNDDAEPGIWKPGNIFPSDLKRYILEGCPIYAWNAGFEMAIWNEIAVKKLAWPDIHIEQWRDVQAISLYFAHPMAMGNCGQVLGLDIQKDKRGEQLKKWLCVPQKITKKNKYTRWSPETHPELFEELYEYNKQDVRATRAILNHFPWELPENEVNIFHHTLRKNKRGIPIDIELVENIIEKTAEYIKEVSTIVPIITKGFVKTINQRDKILEWCEKEGYELPNFTIESVNKAVEDPDIKDFPSVKSLLEIRQLAGKSSVKKFNKIYEAVCGDGRIRDCLKYHKATTGREGGRLVQPQNLPTAEVSNVQHAITCFKTKELPEIMEDYNNVLYTASALIRPSIRAEKGNELIVIDYKQIENRMLCWLADQNDVLDSVRKGVCSYTDMAATLYNQSYEEIPKDSKRRKHGKLAVLGGQYGMGYKTFHYDCIQKKFDISPEEAERTIKAFRKKYNKVKKFWYELEKAAIRAILNEDSLFYFKFIGFIYSRTFLFMILPNKKTIAYPSPRLENTETPWGEIRQSIFHMGTHSVTQKWTKLPLSINRLTENATQASSREILFEAILELEKIKKYDNIILTVHDELVIEAKKSSIDIEELINKMCNLSKTWDGLPLEASGFVTKEYHK
jgi:DNA polymerase